MTPTDAQRRSEAITATLDHLSWFKIPRTIDSIIGVHAEATSERTRSFAYGLTPTELADCITAGTDAAGFGKGGHSDPTANAALRGEPDAVDDDDTLSAIDHALLLIWESATTIDRACSDALGTARWEPKDGWNGRQSRISDAVSRIEHFRPNLEPALTAGTDTGYIDGLVRIDLAETAAWLHTKATNIWAASRGAERPAEQERKLTVCEHCSSWRSNTIAGPSGLCDQCKTFRYHHKCKPTERIVRYWEANGRSSTPPGMILEAQAVSKKTRAS